MIVFEGVGGGANMMTTNTDVIVRRVFVKWKI